MLPALNKMHALTRYAVCSSRGMCRFLYRFSWHILCHVTDRHCLLLQSCKIPAICCPHVGHACAQELSASSPHH